MKNSMVLRTISLIVFGIGSTLFGADTQDATLKVVLAALSNNSEKSVTLSGTVTSKQHAQTIAPLQEKELKSPLEIPFISVRNQDRDAFVSGEPYAPQGSLVIQTKQGHFCMWEDERGIQGAFRFNPEDPAACPREVCTNKKLYNSNVIRAAIVAGRVALNNNQVKLRLFVDSLGHVERAERI
jgi:hypothetical protein